jgi:hypothetical protein
LAVTAPRLLNLSSEADAVAMQGVLAWDFGNCLTK